MKNNTILGFLLVLGIGNIIFIESLRRYVRLRLDAVEEKIERLGRK